MPRDYQLSPFGLQPRQRFYDIETDKQPLQIDKNGGVQRVSIRSCPFSRLTSITAYRRDKNLSVFDADFSKQPYLTAQLNGFSRQFSQELQLASREKSRFDWIVGLFYLDLKAGYVPSRFTGLSVDAAAPLLGLPAGTHIVSDTYG